MCYLLLSSAIEKSRPFLQKNNKSWKLGFQKELKLKLLHGLALQLAKENPDKF